MNVLLEQISNSSFVDTVKIYCNDLSAYIINTVSYLSGYQNSNVLTSLENLPESFCDEFQWKLLKGFSCALLINCILICIAWRIFGKRICERFMKPGNYKLYFPYHMTMLLNPYNLPRGSVNNKTQ